MKNQFSKRILSLAVLAAALFAGQAPAQESISVSAVTVSAAKPGKSDIPRLKAVLGLEGLSDAQIAANHPVYVVKVFARFEPGAAPVVLSIGGAAQPNYGVFTRGVFLRVYDPARLAEWSGRPVQLYRKGPQGEEPASDASAAAFPVQASAASRSLQAAQGATAESAAALPPLEQVLRQDP